MKWVEAFNKNIHGESAGAKIMKQSKQVSLLNKLQLQTTKKERRVRFFSALTGKIDIGLPASLHLCVPTGPNAQVEIGCHVNRVESLFQLFEFTMPSATSKPRTTTFCALRLTNYNGEF